MGSMSLVCPMCCGEAFDNLQSLKYHLLSITDNLYCPNCAERSDSVVALIQHLDCCGEHSESVELQSAADVISIDDQHSFLATVGEDGIVMVGDPRATGGTDGMDVDDDSTDKTIMEHLKDAENNSMDQKEETSIEAVEAVEEAEEAEEGEEDIIVHQVKLAEVNGPVAGLATDHKNLELEAIEVKEEMGEIDNGALYNCSSCGVSFNSVLEHIKEYHDGQEVVLEMAEQALNELPEEEEELDGEVIATAEDSGSIKPEVVAPEKVREGLPRQRQTMNTLRTEECVDSEGRLYTRKVVQIERFWDRRSGSAGGGQSLLKESQQQQSGSKSAPMIEKFFSNAAGLKIRAKSPGTINAASKVASAAASANSSGTVQRTYRCNKCLRQFNKLADFRIHACVHGNNQCDLCDQSFASVKALQLHSRIHEVETESNIDNSFVCQTCGTEFTSHKSLRLHSRMHAPVRARHVDAPEGTDNETFVCPECGKIMSESYRKPHMALHTGDGVTCSVCNRKFDSADSLAMHAAVHTESLNSQRVLDEEQTDDVVNSIDPATGKQQTTGKSGEPHEKPYQCQHCGRRFTRPHEKVKHERIHTGEKPHACEVCGKTFRVSYCLTLHMRTHTGVRPYACQHCGKRFKASSVYNHHLLTHGDERAYTCPYCPKTFKTRVQLAGHKNSHTKPFRCTECSRPFASLYAARAHIQTHKKDNNLKFSCYICGASYGRAFALKDHLKQHADLPPPEPSREVEVADAEDFILPDVMDDYEEIEQAVERGQNVDEEVEVEHKLVAVALVAHSSSLDEQCDE